MIDPGHIFAFFLSYGVCAAVSLVFAWRARRTARPPAPGTYFDHCGPGCALR